jgi:sugar phosphate isomerase/epimerase
MDIGNVFIAGEDPIRFVEQFHDKISYVHVKDISEALAAESRGELTGVAGSHCAIGQGINAENVARCVTMLSGYGYRGVLTIECEAQGGLIEGSLDWMRKLVAKIQRPNGLTKI